MMASILLVGGGGHCKACIDVIEREGRFAIVGLVDLPGRVGETVLGYPIVASDTELPQFASRHWCLVTVGQVKSCALRLRIYEVLRQHQARLPVIISPRAYVSPHATIGPGSIIMHGATVNAGARVGSNCIVNSHALVEHDSVIEDHCHIATAAVVNGGVQVGARSFVGSNAVIREYVVLGEGCFVGAGVRVARELASGGRLV